MGMQCEFCAKKPAGGNQKTYRGKAKYLGGIGKKITGISKRVFKPNLQYMKAADKTTGEPIRVRVCVQCIRSGRVVRPVKKPMFSMQSV